MRIAIGAAAGNVGRHVAENVVRAGAEAVLLVRNVSSLPDHLAAHAHLVDLADPDAVVAATREVDALFWLVPPAPGAVDWEEWYRTIADVGATAIRENRIPRAVLTSSLGAGMAPGLSTISYVGGAERCLNDAGPNVVALRAGYFMENFFRQEELLRTRGLVSFPFAEDHDIPFVSTSDIGAVAAGYLLRQDWAGHWSHNLMGPDNLTLPTCAAIIAEVWGRPVRYERQSEAELLQTFAGMPETMQQEFLALFRGLGDQDGAYATPRTSEVNTPSSFREFVSAELLPRLQAGSRTLSA